MIHTVHATHIGNVRSVNEDLSWVGRIKPGGYTLGIVADGMGGHLAGDTASRLTVETIVADLGGLEAGLSPEACGAALSDAILHANEVVHRQGESDIRYHNMGTTVVAVLLSGTEGVIAHIGDSRAYKITAEGIERLTDDHTLVNELLKSGQISAKEAGSHPRRNVLTRALGTDAEVKVDLDRLALASGEALILCSDGLSNFVAESEMLRTVLKSGEALEDRAHKLIRMALNSGGDDNITVALFENGRAGQDAATKEWVQ
ncbi:Stp1/IreP family PP2C-type Ser/Thr phosphatase [Saccharibacillus sp. CPCC 101409]|uniref:Stp1/IreP family PP2C-type Ser/Thr phosphatase n=1 Tax=Saccharibacillus sp. CPCC 101409 TaxID=3058041 RepID=UPI002672C195|nr:Stp1/IreP family PP2C-type Ser/Thr phosphatase [Saccharibacillus sp. CPCC 101409]MDO3409380.1 Stp1/IreP family PP2C-type Ser/Thr phosphatase [Saccharibacillus sp. CPCC 101409]